MPLVATTGTDKHDQDSSVRFTALETDVYAATATAGAATLNDYAGLITSESLTTAAAADYTLTLTNSAIAAADLVFVTAQLGTSTQGDLLIGAVTPAAGSATIIIRNGHASLALNGTIIIGFLVVKRLARAI